MAQALVEKLERTGPTEKERVASVPQRERERAVGKYARAAFTNRKRNKANCPEYQIIRRERVKVSESRILARERGTEWEHGKEKVDSTVKEGRFQGDEGGQSRSSASHFWATTCLSRVK